MNILEKNILSKKGRVFGVDIDSSSVFNLLRMYLDVKVMFPESEIIVRQSSSGLGFHLIIRLPHEITVLEDILFRAVLGDCSLRVIISLKKIFLSDGEEQYPDIIFDEKNNKKDEPFNFNALLKPFSEKIDYIINNWGRGECLAMIKEVSDQIKPEIESIQKEIYMCCVGFSGDELKERIKKIATDTFEKDNSFKWKIYQSYFKDYDYVFIVYSNNKDQAMQRGAWMKKVLKKEFNVDVFYWVKKKK